MTLRLQVSILILLDYLFLWCPPKREDFIICCLNPYFTGLSILILLRPSFSENIGRLSQSLFYWIIYSYSLQSNPLKDYQDVSILILLDYLFLLYLALCDKLSSVLSQSLFYWIIYSYSLMRSYVVIDVSCLNPYFTGLSILIITAYIIRYDSLSLNPYFTGLSILIVPMDAPNVNMGQPSQSLFYWIIYSYPFCQESLLFIVATEFFSDIKIVFFSIFLVIFCWFFTIFRNS